VKSFNVPAHYRSPLVTAIKARRKAADKMKKDLSPTRLDLGALQVVLARHFGFCYGVENAIEIAFRAVAENQGKRIFLLSEMIHNPGVNADLQALGVRFLMDTAGNKVMNWEELTPEDVVIVPAFGTTLELERTLREKGIEPSTYETTCPFVEKVWNRAEKIGAEGYTVVVHGKPKHEETRATFSHSEAHTPTVVLTDMKEAELLAEFITGKRPAEEFYIRFTGQYSEGFDVQKDLRRIGVVNQTTMLATETTAISDYLKQVMVAHYGLTPETLSQHFADTRDTLCYATADNQGAVMGLLQEDADFALVIGGYNSSNTSHLVELCEETLPTYYIENERCLLDDGSITHFDLHAKQEMRKQDFLPAHRPVKVLITSGASCPDAVVERVIERLGHLAGANIALEELVSEWVA
jgi:4-hydroxy-3-methylbut-2-enyl diphosphate reductase